MSISTFRSDLHPRAGDGTFTETLHPESDCFLSASGSPLDLEWIHEVQSDLSTALNSKDPEDQNLLAPYGGIDLAVVAVGAEIANRAESLAGVTVSEVQSAWGERVAAAQEDYAAAKVVMAEQNALAFKIHQGDPAANSTEGQREAAYTAVVANSILERTKDGRDEQTMVDMKRLSNGYHAALCEVRPMGGAVHLHPDSHKTAAEFFTEAAQYFPTDFLEASNEVHAITPLYAKPAGDRAHYASNVWLAKDRKELLTTEVWRSPEDPNPGRPNDIYYDWKPTGRTQKATMYDYESGKYKTFPDAPVYEGIEFDVIKPGDEFRAKKDGTPWGKGWKSWTHPVSGEQYWRQPKMTTVTSRSMSAEIMVGGRVTSHAAGMDPNMSVALHEFAHRTEDVVRNGHMISSDKTAVGIYQLERRFVERRTTFDGERQELERMYPSKRGDKEMTRPDHFPSRYMGKDYGHSYTEVFSIGMESLFAGEYGGMIGIGRHQEDTETRDFILGTLALATGKRASS